jgi:hypothetical protein
MLYVGQSNDKDVDWARHQSVFVIIREHRFRRQGPQGANGQHSRPAALLNPTPPQDGSRAQIAAEMMLCGAPEARGYAEFYKEN